MKRAAFLWPIALASLCSGASALIFESLWFQQASLVLGSSVWATSVVLAGFMAGLGLGNLLILRWHGSGQRVVWAYIGIEIAIALFGLFIVWALPQLAPWLGTFLGGLSEDFWTLNGLRFLLAAGLLLVPSTAMGVTLPLLTRLLKDHGQSFGQNLSFLYAFNTAGAVLGILIAEYFLLEALGILGSGLVAAMGNLIAASLVALCLRVSSIADDSARAELTQTPLSSLRYPFSLLFLAAFLAGATMLALEVFWFRFLLLYTLPSSTTFAVPLACVLFGLSCGSWVAERFFALRSEKVQLLAVFFAVCPSLCIVVGYYLLRDVAAWELSYGAKLWAISAIWVLPTAVFSGIIFCFLGELIQKEVGEHGRSAALLTFANTTGAVLGAPIATFILLPFLAIENSIFLLTASYLLIGLIVLLSKANRSLKHYALLLPALCSLVAFPFGDMHKYHISQVIRRYEANMSPILVHEGLNETIVYLEKKVFGKPVHHRLVTNNTSMTMNRIIDRRYMNLFAYLPWAFHEDPKDALLISYGMGNTASALTDIETLEHIDVVDISEEIVAFSDLAFKHKPKHPLADSRVKVTIEDGRFFLNSREKKYDIITGEPPPPKAKGVVNLYSQEYFELLKSRLKSGGLVTYWLPLHSLELADTKSIGKAFCNVFDDCTLWRGVGSDWILMGGKGYDQGPSAKHLERVWKESEARIELNNILVETPKLMAATFLGDAAQLEQFWSDALPLRDSHPRRLSLDFPLSVHADLLEWAEAGKREERLRKSSWIRRLWPKEFYPDDKSLNVQRLLKTLWGFKPSKNPRTTLHLIEQIQSYSDFDDVVVRVMGSNADILRIVRALQEDESGRDIAYHRAAEALAGRDYETAADNLVHYIEEGGTEAHVPYVVAYALCRLQGSDRDFVLPGRLANHEFLKDKDFWTWLADRVNRSCALTDS
ncbi:MAG: hypothetical protein CMH60_02005 [Myxococcales bacterium]|nr:hypothetical protein [Myxococcales bacterium]